MARQDFSAVNIRCSHAADASFEFSRALVREHSLSANDLIWPIFVQPGENKVTPINSLPGVNRLTVDRLVDAVGQAADLGIPAVAVFPATDPARKSADGDEALNPGQSGVPVDPRDQAGQAEHRRDL